MDIRAFSLFAPLVGTSVMIIAVIVASVLVNNDIRTSRGITASYSRGELAGVTESIKAFIFATTADTVIGAVHDSLAVPPYSAIEAVCSDSGSCKSNMTDGIGLFASNGINNTLLTAYDSVVNVFVGSVTGASAQNWPGKVRDTLGAQMLQKFEAGNLPGEDPKDSYLTIGPGSLKPEDYTLVLSKGDIIESVPLLPPQGLRIKLPWGIHRLSDALSAASGWAVASGSLDSTCYAKTGKCGTVAPSWTNSLDYKGSHCSTDEAAVKSEITNKLTGMFALPDFLLDHVEVTLEDKTIVDVETQISCSCGKKCTAYGTVHNGAVNIRKIKVDWSVKSKPGILPELRTALSYRNYP